MVGLLGRPEAGACPNLLQRHPGPGSVARRSAEYRRFPFGAPARSGPLQQIRTTCAAAAPGRGVVDRTAVTENAPKTTLDPRENRPAREDAP